jgi:hypothetical protein
MQQWWGEKLGAPSFSYRSFFPNRLNGIEICRA